MDALIFVLYVTVVGITGKRALIYTERKCRWDTHTGDDAIGHHFFAGIVGVFWPVSLPISLGIVIGGKTDKQTRLEAAKQKELQQAEHDAEVARARRIEAEELSRQLRAMGKDV